VQNWLFDIPFPKVRLVPTCPNQCPPPVFWEVNWIPWLSQSPKISHKIVDHTRSLNLISIAIVQYTYHLHISIHIYTYLYIFYTYTYYRNLEPGFLNNKPKPSESLADCTGSFQFLVICYDKNRIARILYRNTCVCWYLIYIYIYIKIYTSQYIYTHIHITFHNYIHQNRVKYQERMIFSTKHFDMGIVTVTWRFISLSNFLFQKIYSPVIHGTTALNGDLLTRVISHLQGQ